LAPTHPVASGEHSETESACESMSIVCGTVLFSFYKVFVLTLSSPGNKPTRGELANDKGPHDLPFVDCEREVNGTWHLTVRRVGSFANLLLFSCQ